MERSMSSSRPDPQFTRIVPVPYPVSLAAVTAALSVPAAGAATDGARWHVRLSQGRLRRAVPMRLELSPWDGPGSITQVELIPTRSVALTRPYFRAGHRWLDDLAGVLAAGSGRERWWRRPLVPVESARPQPRSPGCSHDVA